MARKNSLLKIVDPQLITSGIKPSLHELAAPLWIDGENVNFSEGKVWKTRGWSAAFVKPGTTPVRGMCQLRVSGVQYVFFGDQTDIHYWNSAVVTTDPAVFTGRLDDSATALASTWSMVPWGSWVLATNGKDVPQVWKGASFAALAGVTFSTAEIFLVYGPFVLAFNTSNGGNWIEWCDDDDVEDWTVLTTNAAGNLKIRAIDSDIMAAVRLGDRIAVYSRDQMHIVSFVGAPFYFGVKPALNGIGAVGKQAVCEDERRNWGCSRQGIWVTDGAGYKYVDDPDFRRWLQDNVNWAQASKIVAYNNELRNRVEFFFPTGVATEPDAGWAIDKTTRAATKLGYGRTSALPRQVFENPVLSAADGSIYYHEFGVDADGVALQGRIQTKPFPVGDPHFWATIDELVGIVTDLTGTFQVRIGTQARLDDAIVWTAWQTIDKSTDRIYPPFNTSGVYIRFEFQNTAALGADWSLAGFIGYGAGQGLDTDDSQ